MQQPNNPMPWQAWVQEVQRCLSEQQAKIIALEKQQLLMQEQLRALESKPTYNIESLSYHFDQLKVEKLEGTLNIGMSPPGTQPFEQAVDQYAVSKPLTYPSAAANVTPPAAPYPAIRAQVDDYLNNEAPARLAQIEQELCLPLDPYHRRIVIEDIRKQMPTRIQYYMTSLKESSSSDAGESQADAILQAQVSARTIRDADLAMQQYVQQLSHNQASNGGALP
ncbi:spore germination protein GerPC [Paenibacillus sp. GCM10023252]|uniref:spore germination protein GerPC n=1 Tax=Paenibacillus sp. GCM10023252 TaxID=3252649 RepID=UPI00361D505D